MNTGFRRHFTGYLPLAVAVLLTIGPVLKGAIPDRATADRAAASVAATAKANAIAAVAPTVLSPASIPFGVTYEQWSVAWWQWFLTLTNDQVVSCATGSLGPVTFLLAGPPTCSAVVASNSALFFPIANVECSNLEPDPFHGDTAAQRRSCAQSYLPLLFGAGQTMSVEVDDATVPNLTSYRADSPDFPFSIKGPDNVYGLTCERYPCAGQSTATGFYLMLAPLSPGLHNIRIVATGFGIDTTFRLAVGTGRARTTAISAASE